MTSQKYLDVARNLAQNASDFVLDLLNKPISQSRKKDHSIVTEADLGSDKILREGLSKAFPDHAILTEESGLSGKKDAEFVWVIDPLDGTKAYAKGIPGFSIMVGLLKAGRPYLGVVIDPLEGFIYEAVRGEGTFLTALGRKMKLHVSERNDLSKMPLAISTGFPEKILEDLKKQYHMPVCPPINSVGIKVGLVVRGDADVYLSHHPVHLWDICAPQIILEEAGGKVTDFQGKSLSYDLSDTNRELSILATNGLRHDEWVKLISERPFS